MVHKQSKKPKRSWGWLLISAALTTLVLKFVAYQFSGSVGIFSDAAESLVNVTAAFFVLFALTHASKPADREHSYGHEKIEFFSSGLEGTMIIIAAIWIIYEAAFRFLHPIPLLDVGLGLKLVILAAAINGVVAKFLLRSAKHFDSIVLEASAKHLWSDVWTTGAVVVGLGLVMITKVPWLDPLMAFLIGLNVIWSGVQLVMRSYGGLMDKALPEEEIEKIKILIQKEIGKECQFHALRTRKSGARRFIDFHLLMPGHISLKKSHEMTFKIEKTLEKNFHETDVTIHMEPIEDPKSWEDGSLSRRIEE